MLKINLPCVHDLVFTLNKVFKNIKFSNCNTDTISKGRYILALVDAVSRENKPVRMREYYSRSQTLGEFFHCQFSAEIIENIAIANMRKVVIVFLHPKLLRPNSISCHNCHKTNRSVLEVTNSRNLIIVRCDQSPSLKGLSGDTHPLYSTLKTSKLSFISNLNTPGRNQILIDNSPLKRTKSNKNDCIPISASKEQAVPHHSHQPSTDVHPNATPTKPATDHTHRRQVSADVADVPAEHSHVPALTRLADLVSTLAHTHEVKHKQRVNLMCIVLEHSATTLTVCDMSQQLATVCLPAAGEPVTCQLAPISPCSVARLRHVRVRPGPTYHIVTPHSVTAYSEVEEAGVLPFSRGCNHPPAQLRHNELVCLHALRLWWKALGYRRQVMYQTLSAEDFRLISEQAVSKCRNRSPSFDLSHFVV